MSLEDALYPLLKCYEAAPQGLKSAAGYAYRALPASLRYGSHHSRFCEEARDVEQWSADQIRQYQIGALRESLRAAQNAEFYSKRFKDAGVDPSAFESLDQLKAYPYLTKGDLLENRESMVNPEFGASQRLYLTTGGSSGVPVGFYLHRGVSRPKEQAYLDAQWSRRGYSPGDRVAVIRGGVTSSRSDGRISYFDATRNWLVLSSYHLTADRLPEYVARLNAFAPQHLHAYPSAALMLAKGMKEMGLCFSFQLRSLLCGSEKLTVQDQVFLEQHFEARLFHWYGHSERVVLAGQGRTSNHLYFWPTYGYAELGEPDAQGLCEVIGTSFHNLVMPLIRYRTGDYVRLPERLDAELPGLEVEAVVGREYEFLVSATGRRISLTAINMHDGIFDGLLAVQFRQAKVGEVDFCYQPGGKWDERSVGAIRSGLLKKLGDDFSVHMVKVSEVEKTLTGKHKWLITSLK